MNSADIQGKKILLLAWRFYEYPEHIKKELEKMGAIVVYYNAVPSISHLAMKFYTKFNFLRKKYESDIINKEKNNKYDWLIVINPALFENCFLEELISKVNFKNKVAYLWDSISTFPNVNEQFYLFDRIFSFDLADCNSNENLTFLPLFYSDNFESCLVNSSAKYDFSFVGFAHTQRYKFIEKIKKMADENGYSYCFKLYLPSYVHYLYGKYIKRNFPNANKNDFIFKPMNQSEIAKIMNDSKIVIDMELKNQNGLTMRTVETLGMKKKLITTNPHIKQYDFYNENNVLVVERENPNISKNFVETKYCEVSKDIYKKYSLYSWLMVILGDNI